MASDELIQIPRILQVRCFLSVSTWVEGDSAQPCYYRRRVISSSDFARALDGDALVSKLAMLWPTHSGRKSQLRLLIHTAGVGSDFCSLIQKRLSPVQNVCQGQTINTGSVSHSFFQLLFGKKKFTMWGKLVLSAEHVEGPRAADLGLLCPG